MFHPRASRSLLIFLSFALLCLSAHKAQAQSEGYVPATTGFDTEIKVWTSAGNTYAKVRLTFPTGGWRVDWGQVTRTGNNFVAEGKVDRWNGITTQAITFAENTYSLGQLSPGTYSFTFKSYGVVKKTQQFDPSLIAEHWEPTSQPSGVVIRIWTTAEGVTYTKIELFFPDTGYSVVDWGQISRSGNEFSVDIKAERWTGESQARTTHFEHDYPLGALSSGSYTLAVKMYGATVRTQAFSITAPTTTTPKLMTEENSERAIALDSVTWLRLFPLENIHNFSADQRTRIVLFLTGVELSPGETIVVQAEDAGHTIYPMTVEYVGKVPGFDWLTQVIVRPTDGLKDGNDLWVNVSVRGVTSNKGLVSIKPVGTTSQ
jgi:hypothetical protein